RLLESGQEAGNGARAHGDQLAHLYIARTQLAGGYLDLLVRLRNFHPQQLFRELLTEPTMNLADALAGGGATGQLSAIHPGLHRDVGAGFALQVALSRIPAVVALQGALDVHRMRVMSFDEVAVVAVHRPDQCGQGWDEAGRKRTPETFAAPRQLQGQIDELRAGRRPFA